MTSPLILSQGGIISNPSTLGPVHVSGRIVIIREAFPVVYKLSLPARPDLRRRTVHQNVLNPLNQRLTLLTGTDLLAPLQSHQKD